MTTPISPNPISLDDVQTEFGGSNPIEIVEYYAGGSYVPVSVTGIPTSGQISLNDFYNKTKTVYAFSSATMSVTSNVYPFNSTISWTSNLPTGGYVNITITYPNSTTSTLSNLGINSSSTVNFTQSTGVGAGSVTLRGYNSAGSLLVTTTINYTVLQSAVLNNVYFSPSSITAGVTSFALYWSVSYASKVDWYITYPNGTVVSGSSTNLDSNTTQYISYSSGTMFGEIVAYGTNGGTVSRQINIAVAAQPTYTFTRSAASVNEGGSFSITFSTNQAGYYSYTISGVSSNDISGAGLTGYVTNGSVLSYSVTEDQLTEGTEYFTISLDNGLASTTVTINDTSVAIVYPSISGLTASPTNAYPDSAITVSWNPTNAVTSSTILQIFFPTGGYYQFTNMAANSRYFGPYSFTDVGLYTVNVYVYSVTGQQASASTNFYVRTLEIIPTISASASPTSGYNTDVITVSWNTTNASYVNINITYPGGSGQSYNTYNVNSSTTFGGSGVLPIGSYSMTLTAYSSTSNTASTTVYWTFNAAAVFTATYAGSGQFPGGYGPNVYVNSDNIIIYGRGNNSIDYFGQVFYTTNMAGYVTLYLNVSTEANYDFGYIYLDGTLIGSGSGVSSPVQGAKRYVAAGSHYIQVRYTKDGSVSGNDDGVGGSWSWSAT